MKQITTIELVTIDNTTYYSTERNGVTYTCYFTPNGEWCLHSHRKALGRSNMGSYRHYKDITKLASAVKAFNQLPALLAVPTNIVMH